METQLEIQRSEGGYSLKRNENILSELGQKVLLDAENYYKEHGSFSDEILQNLHSIYGETVEEAFDILDKGKIIKYEQQNGVRHVFVITVGEERFVLFANVNFCFCNEFRDRIFSASRDALTCCHAVALKFAEITGKTTVDNSLKEGKFIELLNNARVFAKDKD